MESTRNCPLQFLMDLRNWAGDVDPRDTWKGRWTWCHPVCSFLTPWFKFPAVDESRVPPSSSSLPACNFQSWQLPWLQSTGYTTGTFRYFCVLPAMLSFCSMQENDPMGRACLLEELNAEILLMIILFNISSALKKKKKEWEAPLLNPKVALGCRWGDPRLGPCSNVSGAVLLTCKSCWSRMNKNAPLDRRQDWLLWSDGFSHESTCILIFPKPAGHKLPTRDI